MRIPASSSPQTHHHLSSDPKPTVRNLSNVNPAGTCYEPTSVLDLCGSPSTGSATVVPENPAAQSAITQSSLLSKPEDCLEWDDHALHSLDWDSIMKDYALHDDSLAHVLKSTAPRSNPCDQNHVPHLPEFPNSQEVHFDQSPDLSLSDVYMNQNLGGNYSSSFDHLVHHFNHNQSWQSNGFDLMIEELIRAADCFDTNQLQLAQVILERLNQRLRSPVGKPLHRAAFYFKDALQSLLSGSNRTPRLCSLEEIVQSIRTFKAFSGISPIPMFSIFTTNQALLEALHGSSFMHIIDFEIGLGIQYASLMKEIAEKAESCKINSPVLRITAVVPDEYAVESKLVRENLNQFANDLRIRVQTEFVLFRAFETSLLKAVKFMDGEKAAVLLSPPIFRRLGSTKNIAAFLGDIRRVSPSVVVFVDGEGWADDDAAATSFRRSVVNSLEFYSMMLESLDASLVGGGEEWIRRIEMLLLRPKILTAVEGGGRRIPAWRELLYRAGMRAVQLSRFADFQAECLLAKVQIKGFNVAKRHAELVLFWNERAMVSTSAWRC